MNKLAKNANKPEGLMSKLIGREMMCLKMPSSNKACYIATDFDDSNKIKDRSLGFCIELQWKI